jgi:hypothetical protein
MRTLLLAALALLAASCSSTPRYIFMPRPLTVDIQWPETGEIVARAVIAVAGLREGSAKEGLPDEMMLRLSLENLSDDPIGLEPGVWKLMSADLRPFGPATVEPADDNAILPGGEKTVELYFPVPEGAELDAYDLSGLNLRFGVRYRTGTIVSSATFERWVRTSYDPYGYAYPYASPYGANVSFGAGITIGN